MPPTYHTDSQIFEKKDSAITVRDWTVGDAEADSKFIRHSIRAVSADRLIRLSNGPAEMLCQTLYGLFKRKSSPAQTNPLIPVLFE